jgi:hypothetical protein
MFSTAGNLVGLRRSLVSVYASVNDADNAFKWLEVAYGQRSPGLTVLKAGLEWDNIRADPRFARLLQRINLAPDGPEPSRP